MMGLRIWLFWGLAAGFYSYSFFQRVAPSVMVDELMRDFAVTAAILGNLSAVYFYAYAAVQMPAGLLIDRFGVRRLLSAACALTAAGSVLFAWAPSTGEAVVGRLLVGTGAGFGWVCALKVVADWFPPQRFALLTGLSLALGLGGGLAAQVPLAALVEAFGWRTTLLGGAGVGGVLALAIFAVLRDPARPPAPARRGGGMLLGMGRILRSRASWIVSFQAMTLNASVNGIGGLWGVPFLMSAYALARTDAAALASSVMLGWAVGSPVAGWLSDRLGSRRKPMIVGSGLATLAVAAVVYVPGLPLPVLAALLFAYGASAGVTVIAYAAMRELHPPEAAGAAIGFSNFVAVAGIGALQVFTGVALDLVWSGASAGGAPVYSEAEFRVALAFYPLLLLAGHGLSWIATETALARRA